MTNPPERHESWGTIAEGLRINLNIIKGNVADDLPTSAKAIKNLGWWISRVEAKAASEEGAAWPQEPSEDAVLAAMKELPTPRTDEPSAVYQSDIVVALRAAYVAERRAVEAGARSEAQPDSSSSQRAPAAERTVSNSARRPLPVGHVAAIRCGIHNALYCKECYPRTASSEVERDGWRDMTNYTEPLDDHDKLMALAQNFDMRDDERSYTGPREVQADLRRIAKTLPPPPASGEVALLKRAMRLTRHINYMAMSDDCAANAAEEVQAVEKAVEAAEAAYLAARPVRGGLPKEPSDEAKLAFVKAHSAVDDGWIASDRWEEALTAGLRAAYAAERREAKEGEE